MIVKIREQCDCKFHKGAKVYGILDSVIAEGDLREQDKEFMRRCPVGVETYPSSVYRDGDTIYDIRHRVAALKVRVFYQNMALNVDAHYGDNSKLKVAVDDATFITEFIWNPLEHSLTTFFDAVYAYQNNLYVPPGHPDRPLFAKAGHTSMSIGDFVLLKRCVPQASGIEEYIDSLRLWRRIWVCSADGWVLWS